MAGSRGDDSEFSAAAVRSVNRRVWSPHPGQRLFRVRACISLSLQKVRNFAHFWGIFKYRIHHEILNLFEYSLFACRHRLIKYAPAVSDVVYRHLEVVVGALKKTHIFTLRT